MRLRRLVPPHRPRSERGETLIEVMVTVVLLSLAVITILQGIFSLAENADLNNQATTGSILAQSYAEQLLQPSQDPNAPSAWGDPTYVPCATTSTYPAFHDTVAATKPAGWTVEVVAVDYLGAKITAGAAATATWTGTCTAGNDLGLQQIYIDAFRNGAASASRFRERTVIVKRNVSCPNASGASPC